MSREMKSNNIAVSWKILFFFWHVQPCNHQSSFELWVYKKNELDSDFSSISWRPGVQLYNQIKKNWVFVFKLFSDTLECVSVWLGSRMKINYPWLEKSSVHLGGEFCWSLFNSKEKYNSRIWNVSHCLKPLPNLQEAPFQHLVFMRPCLKQVKGHCIKCLDVSCSVGFNWTIYLHIYTWLMPGGMQNSYYIRRQ